MKYSLALDQGRSTNLILHQGKVGIARRATTTANRTINPSYLPMTMTVSIPAVSTFLLKSFTF
jgi:hypothetical protein